MRLVCGLRRTRRPAVLVAAGWLLVVLAGAASAQEAKDPWEGFNRKVYAFNDKVDTWLLRPVAKGYDTVTPDPVQQRVGNFFDNLYDPIVAVNQLLQGKPRAGLNDLTRFVVNTSVGVGGLFDVASANGLRRHDEDFGQTIAVWNGRDQGTFVMLPFRGPATVTHAGGMVVQVFVSPLRLLSPGSERIIVGAVEVIDSRADLLSAEDLISGDEYLFMRDAYLQSRDYEINDGVVEEDPFLDDF